VVATALVVLGSLFYVEREGGGPKTEDTRSVRSHDDGCSRPRPSTESGRSRGSIRSSVSRIPSRGITDQAIGTSTHGDIPESERGTVVGTGYPAQSNEEIRVSIESRNVTTYHIDEPPPQLIDNKHRNTIARSLHQISEYLGMPAANPLGSGFLEGRALEFPTVPAEEYRNSQLAQTQDKYTSSRQQGDHHELSRVNSVSSIRTSEGGPTNREASPSRPPGPRSRSNTAPVEPNESSFELNGTATGMVRRETLQVPNQPGPVHTRPRNSSASSATSPTTILDTQGSPKIVVSAEPEETSPNTPTIDAYPFAP
jgi:hypothetical protein